MFNRDPDDTQTDLPTSHWGPPADAGASVEPTPVDAPPPAADAPPAFVPAPVEPVQPGQPAYAGGGWAPTPTPAPAPAPAPASSGGSGGGLRTVVTAAVLSAVLASGATIGVLDVTGALNRTAANGGSGSGTASHQSVTIDESSAVIDVASKASPAVVQITASGQSTDNSGGVIPETGVGSGIIFDAGGWILTNRHVVTTSNGQTAAQLSVLLKDGRQFTGSVYGIDTLTDLAIVKIDAKDLPAATIGSSSDLKVGELAIAIGSPLGTYTNSVTSGIVSATGRTVVVDTSTALHDLIQTDAAINPGNSGGPLLDAAGNVIGINTAVAQGSNGIGFAIPVDIAKPIMSQALAGQQLARPYIGIRYQEIDVQVETEKHLTVDHGALIGPGTDASGGSTPAIEPGSPADKAGLKDGDVITAIEDQQIDQTHPLDATLAEYAPGQTIQVHIIRGTQALTLTVTLGTRPPNL
ncbi:MAG TPA: trypsin-like peptidase domain-containing protein [Candidatus Limnocylindrales bacterium]